jgi:hypothetical protein
MTKNNTSKETILQRLYNHAAGMWGVQSVEDLDPFVKLMMQGVSSMLYDVNNEIEDINVRMLESLAAVLTPGSLINPRPAHAIAQAYPAEPAVYIDRKTVFLDKRIPAELQNRGIKYLSFVPMERVRLVSGKIKYLVTERFFHRVEENGDKTTLAQAHTLSEKTNHTLWIGIELHPEVETFHGLSFYIDFPLAAEKYDKYRILPYSRWSVGGEPLDMKAGLPRLSEEEGENTGDYNSIFDTYNLLSRIDENISALYRMRYLTVISGMRLDGVQKELFPGEICGLFPERAASTEPCHWIKVVFPVHIPVQDIHAVKVCINTFPVANKTFYSNMHPPAETTVGIIPMRTQEGEQFIAVEKVSDSHGTEYRDLPDNTGGNSRSGFYSLKRGGVERFDRRNAAEYLERMIDLLRDESVAFSSLNADNMQNTIFEIQKGLHQIATKYAQSTMAGLTIPSYLLLNRTDSNDTVFVEYWATCCELANGLRAGKLLTLQSSVFLVKNSCRLITETRGGKSEASASGRQDAFRYVLTAREGIITQEDAANFCRYELGAKVIQVKISRGVAVSAKPKEGLIRTIDVHLTPSPGCEQIVKEMQTDLLVMLHLRSPDSFNYRIIMES